MSVGSGAIASLSVGRSRTNGRLTLVTIAAATCLLMVPALWNGFVFLYWDSKDYIQVPFTWTLPQYRTLPYPLFSGLARIAGSPWIVAWLQSLLAAYLLHESLAVFTRWSPAGALLPVTLLLVLVTGLPWFTGQLMPDAFTGLVVLGFASLAFGGRRLAPARRAALTLLVLLGAMLHTSHFGVLAGLILSMWVLGRWIGERHLGGRPQLGLPLLALAGAAVLTLALHWVFLGKAVLTQPSELLWLGRLVEDDIAQQLLDDVCPRQPQAYRLCAFRDRLPETANSFLWDVNNIPTQLGGWDALRAEARQILKDSLERYPGLHLRSALNLTVRQFFMLQTGDGMVDNYYMMFDSLEARYPQGHLQFKASRQRSGIDFAAINQIEVPILLGAQVLLLVLLPWAWRHRDGLATALIITVWLALLGNAFICGALSNPNHRYQSRIAWIAVFAVVAVTLGRRQTDDPNPVLP